ncbi:MAG: peptidylprolyl isomerase A [Gammaproteobacteria bacterium]|nr:MAG: peptidylprolyl isomerase A [Gammaproteobacteria bacterium]
MLNTKVRVLLAVTLLAATAHGYAADASLPRVTMETSMGTLVIELDPRRAPVTTANFLRYVDAGYYDGLIFHRVIPGFMIQGGGFDATLARREPGESIINESGNGLINVKGSIAMARTSDPNSASSQFFINTNFNNQLDARPGSHGYAVFGRVVDGMDTVMQIELVATTTMQGMNDVPRKPVVIQSARRVP